MAEDNSRFDPPSEESPEWYDADSSNDAEDAVESYEDDYYESSDAFLTDDDDLYYDDGDGGGPLFTRNPIILVLVIVAIIVILLLVLRACGVIGATGSESVTPTVKPAATVAGEVATTPGAEPGATVAPPTATPLPPTPTPATVQVGARVVVAGTGEDGMSFRTGPGTKYIRISVLKDGDILKVVGGPEEADGFTWWRLEAEDGTIGWAVGDFLELAAG